MANKITCTCGHSWNKSDSSKKDMRVCHVCGKDNTMKDGGWLSKFEDAPSAQNGIEGTMGGLTDKGFNFNPAWGGAWRDGGTLQPPMAGADQTVPMYAMGGSLPGAVGFTYARTAGAAPSEGPYAKKTLPSAQTGDTVLSGKEYVQQWMGSPMYKQMLEASSTPNELSRISEERSSNINRPVVLKKGIDSESSTLGALSPRVRTFMNLTFDESTELENALKYASQNPGNKEARRNVEKFMQPTITGYQIEMNPKVKPGTVDYEAILAHEYGHTTDNPFLEKLPSQMSKKELMSATTSPLIPVKDLEKIKLYSQDKTTDEYSKYISKPQETRQYLNELRYLGKSQGVYDPFTEKIDLERYKRIKPTSSGFSNPMEALRSVYTDEQIIDMLNSISKAPSGEGIPTAQNGAEMSFYQQGLDWKPKTISRNGGWLDKFDDDVPQAQTGILKQRYSTGPMMGDLATQSGVPTQAEVARQAQIRKEAAAREQQLAARARYEAMPKIGPAKQRNYSEQVAAEEQRRRLNQQYADQNPEVTVDDSGDIVPSGYGRFMQTYGSNLDKFARSLETPLGAMSLATGVGSIASNTLRLGASALEKKIGRNLVSRGLKNFTGKVTPVINSMDDIAAYAQLDPVGIMGNRLNALSYNPTTALNTATNTITGVERNLTNSGIETADLVLGENNTVKLLSKEVPTSIAETLSSPQKAGFLNPIALADKIIPRPLTPLQILGMNDSWNYYSPLNLIPGYGRKLIDKTSKYPNIVGFRKFGNSIDDVIESQSLRPRGTGMGAEQIKGEGNWAEPGRVNEHYPGVFEATMDPRVSGSNIKLEAWARRNGIVGTTKEGDVAIPLTDPGLSLNRRLPFSSRYVPIDKEKLMSGKFQMATQLPHLQSLAEKYGLWAALAAGSGYAMGGEEQALENLRTLNKYSVDPVLDLGKNVYHKGKELDKKLGIDFYNKKEDGGEIVKDNEGYWNPENWGKPVEINSNKITMEGVLEPLLGVSDTGDTKMMYPGKNYTFDGTKVVEYPREHFRAEDGKSVNRADEYPLEKLDNLLNFTNYNKPKAKSGKWLDKYK